MNLLSKYIPTKLALSVYDIDYNELYANGKLIAYGEVVVIEDNFGLRITHITDPAKRLHSLGANASQEQQPWL